MWVVKHRSLFYAFSIILVIASIVALTVWGLRLGIDFTGGTLVNVSYEGTRPSQETLAQSLSSIDDNASIRPSGDDSYIIRMRPVSQEEKGVVMNVISINNTASTSVNAFDSIGPVLGAEAVRKAGVSIILVILAIVLYITFAFRKVSDPVQSWKYGLTAIIALAHDVIIPVGVFAVLGQFAGYEVDTLFVTALLVILGFSIHDTIVVFDRIRENLRTSSSRKTFAEIVGDSISQTMVRSINTSMTTLIALVVLYFFGGSSTEHFSLALIIGIAAGTYSSIFVGSSLLVTLEKWQAKRAQ